MNTAQARNIPLRDILQRLGLEPVKSFKGGEELAYVSPFRHEKEPSLFVNVRKNLWNDFGGDGGNALDFVIRYHNTDVRGALAFLEQLFGSNSFSSSPRSKPQLHQAAPEPTLLLQEVNPFTPSNAPLWQYITGGRGILPQVAQAHLKEVRFTHQKSGKAYFAAGFANRAGGYEIRNPFFKGSVGSKDISLIQGPSQEQGCWIFEGFLDFLSHPAWSQGLPVADAVVLNSVAYTEKAIEHLRLAGYARLLGFLDNDKAGDAATQKLAATFGGNFSDLRYLFAGVKDLNEFWCKQVNP